MCSGPFEEQQGLCPCELEARIPSSWRQEKKEKKELQTALEASKKRLHVKEAEASW